jgi:hypothetical protein
VDNSCPNGLIYYFLPEVGLPLVVGPYIFGWGFLWCWWWFMVYFRLWAGVRNSKHFSTFFMGMFLRRVLKFLVIILFSWGCF